MVIVYFSVNPLRFLTHLGANTCRLWLQVSHRNSPMLIKKNFFIVTQAIFKRSHLIKIQHIVMLKARLSIPLILSLIISIS
jgi:hypothetical protein